MKKTKVELLAPAGSFDIMKAVIAAGADAVYMGGPMFGARAFAQNPDLEQFAEAIDYAHLRGVKLYMTVNTLLKEQELEQQLYDYLLPLYERGLDAVIVQDFGVLEFVRKAFPDMDVHASTQMTITGPGGTEMLKKLGVSRVVTARELNLSELREIATTGLEVESFVHGAICYCYSGKCLFSSLAGGRSGNRGRCAQPCRQPYSFIDEEGRRISSSDKAYLMSLKDMNTLEILPEIIDAGVYSLKIEGRMKKAEYAAGVVSIYRKYIDLYLSGREYKVTKADQNRLLDLFNRNGFSSGYYKQKNSAAMMSLTEVDFRTHDDEWNNEIVDKYINNEKKPVINMHANIALNENITISASCMGREVIGTFDEPSEATGKPMTEDMILKQLRKMGGSDFDAGDISIDLSGNCFIPVSVLNSMRRDTIEALRKELLAGYRRYSAITPDMNSFSLADEKSYVAARVTLICQLSACLKSETIDRIYIDSRMVNKGNIADISRMVRESGKEAYFAYEEPFRAEHRAYYDNMLAELEEHMDGFLCDSMESLSYTREHFADKDIVAEHSMYSWNERSKGLLKEWGVSTFTAPLELKLSELLDRKMDSTELVVYGYLPMMTTANCIWKNTGHCRKNTNEVKFGRLIDKNRREFRVSSACRFCGNVIYNCVPLVLYDQKELVERLDAKGLRYNFTFENEKEALEILKGSYKPENITRGHIKRGVE